jgi:hypothetical protein
MHESIDFSTELILEVQAAAIFVAQLVREGVTFKLSRAGYMIRVTITGGF